LSEVGARLAGECAVEGKLIPSNKFRLRLDKDQKPDFFTSLDSRHEHKNSCSAPKTASQRAKATILLEAESLRNNKAQRQAARGHGWSRNEKKVFLALDIRLDGNQIASCRVRLSANGN
jgi:hypothetical protein